MVHFVILVLENTRKSGVSALILEVCRVENKKNKAKCNPKRNPKLNISFLQGQKCNPKRNPKCNPKPNFRPFTDTKKPVPAIHIPERASKPFKYRLSSVKSAF